MEKCQALNRGKSQLYNIFVIIRMSFEKEWKDQLVDLPDQSLRLKPNHTSSKFCPTQTSPSVLPFDFESCMQSAIDTSFDGSFHAENIESIKTAADRLLEECLQGPFNKEEGFRDQRLCAGSMMQFKTENELESLVTQNMLFDKQMVKQMCELLEKEGALIGFLKEIPDTFGLTVAKEIAYVVYRILKHKKDNFELLLSSKETLLPKFACFHDCSQEDFCQLTTSCPVYDEISLEEVVQFAERDMESLGSKLYFSNLRILNLNGAACELKPGVDVIEKFTKFAKQISKAVFLTLVGGTEPNHAIFGLDLSRQISLASFSDLGVSIQRSMSNRGVVYEQEEESCENLSKKIKFE